MNKILITGATGNVGLATLKALKEFGAELDLVAGVRDIKKAQAPLNDYTKNLVYFDFTDLSSFDKAFADCEVLFLLRPPQISAVRKYFQPLMTSAKKNNIKHIVFLSVQGAENSSFIPHHKIEKLIVESQIPYTFLRPAYFMQNFTTTLRHELLHKNRVFLPAGKAKFTLIDIEDVGLVAAQVIMQTEKYKNQAFALTNDEQLDFQTMTQIINQQTGKHYEYISPNLLRFFIAKKKDKVPTMFILVMIMLHYLPRFQRISPTSQWVKKITGKTPTRFVEFVEQSQAQLRKD